jgi:hypothetical protein
MTKQLAIITLIFILSASAKAQNPSEFLPDKPGKWSYYGNIKTPGADYAAFNKNLSALAEWFHQNTPMLKNPVGYDLHAKSYGISNDDYKKNAANYGLRSEMVFAFQLFYPTCRGVANGQLNHLNTPFISTTPKQGMARIRITNIFQFRSTIPDSE